MDERDMAMDVARVIQLLDSSPFLPFSVDLENGKRIQFTHPENVTLFPDRARVKEILVYYPDRDGTSIIWLRGITAVHVGDVREDVV